MTLFNTFKYGNDINSYDVLKAVAIILMVIDHIGYFFFPDQLYWRAVGRICVPIWFFMVGYSKAEWKDFGVLGGMVVLVLVDALLYSPIFALNILATITLLRLAHQKFLNRYLETFNSEKLIAVTVLIIAFYPLSFMLWEYGTLALTFSIAGFFARHNRQDRLAALWFVVAALLFCAFEGWLFRFSIMQNMVMVLGIGTVTLHLWHFSMKTYPLPKLNNVMRSVFLFLARNSLVIYVVHWIVFLAINHHLHPEKYMVFQWFRG